MSISPNSLRAALIEPAHRRYCQLYWAHNELQLAYADFPSKQLIEIIERYAREMEACVQYLGYVPAP